MQAENRSVLNLDSILSEGVAVKFGQELLVIEGVYSAEKDHFTGRVID